MTDKPKSPDSDNPTKAKQKQLDDQRRAEKNADKVSALEQRKLRDEGEAFTEAEVGVAAANDNALATLPSEQLFDETIVAADGDLATGQLLTERSHTSQIFSEVNSVGDEAALVVDSGLTNVPAYQSLQVIRQPWLRHGMGGAGSQTVAATHGIDGAGFGSKLTPGAVLDIATQSVNYNGPQMPIGEAIISGDDRGNVIEDNVASSKGDLQESNHGHFVAEKINTECGQFAVDERGHWHFQLDNKLAATQHLAAGEQVSESFTVTTVDGVSHQVKVVIAGTDDLPVIDSIAQEQVFEDGALLTGVVTATDVDRGDSVIFSTVAPIAGFVLNADGSYQFDPSSSSYQHLAAGQSQLLVIPIIATDSEGQTVSGNLQITVVGTNDLPVISGIDNASVSDSNTARQFLHAPGQLNITDADNGEEHFQAETIAGAYGSSLGIHSDGSWIYTVNRLNPDVVSLNKGEVLHEKFTVHSVDGTEHIIQTEIVGANTPAIITGSDSGQTTEDLLGGDHASGQLDVLDPDKGQNHFVAVAAQHGDFGSLTINSAGHWQYQLDNNQQVTQALRGKQTGQDLFFVQSVDGSRHGIAIDVHGSNDQAAIGGLDAGLLKEDENVIAGNIVADGKLAVTDIDSGENSFRASSYAGSYGSLLLAGDGSWHYQANNGDARVQELSNAQNLTETVRVYSLDGTAHDIHLVIVGTNDAPVLNAITARTGIEDGALISGAISSQDVDRLDGVSYRVLAPVPGFSLQANGKYTFNPGDPYYQHLAAGQSTTITIAITVSDGHGGQDKADLQITVQGTNDAPVAINLKPVSVTEGDVAGLSGQFTATDLDDKDSATFAVSAGAPSLPGFSLNTDGTWNFDSTDGAFDHLAKGDTSVFTVPVTVTDKDGGTDTTQLQITVTGTNDNPVAASFAPEIVAEGNAAGLSGQFTATDLDDKDSATFTVSAGAPALPGIPME